jgi:hypothetical protein
MLWSALWWPTARSSSTSSRITPVSAAWYRTLLLRPQQQPLVRPVQLIRRCCRPCISALGAALPTATDSFPAIILPLSPPAVKEVQKSAFVSTLRERMAQLRHSKLYKASKKEVLRVRGVNRNPMKVRGGPTGPGWRWGGC